MDRSDRARSVPPMLIAICGLKGGTGKTTVAVALAAELERRGRRTLLVDADPVGAASLWGRVADAELPPVIDLAAESSLGRASVSAGLGFAHTIVDCRSGHPESMADLLAVADLALLPCNPSPADAWALGPSFEVVTEARHRNSRLRAAVVLNGLDRRTTLSRCAKVHLEAHGVPVLDAGLTRRIAHPEALASGSSVVTGLWGEDVQQEVETLTDEVERLGLQLRSPAELRH